MAFHNPIPESHRRHNKEPGGLAQYVLAEKLMQIPFVLLSAAAIGWLGGAWADRHFHQKWIAVAGMLFGSVAGMYYVIRLALAVEKSTPADSAGKNGNETAVGTAEAFEDKIGSGTGAGDRAGSGNSSEA